MVDIIIVLIVIVFAWVCTERFYQTFLKEKAHAVEAAVERSFSIFRIKT